MPHEPLRLLYVDDEPVNLTFFAATFGWDFTVVTTDTPATALSLLQAQSFDIVVSDQRMPGMQGTELLAIIAERYPITIRMLLTAYGDLPTLTAAVNQGHIYQLIQKPWEEEDVRRVLENAGQLVRLRRENQQLIDKLHQQNGELGKSLAEISELKKQIEEENQVLRETITQTFQFDEIVTRSEVFRQVLNRARQVATTETTVLILGETGTGKELLARAIHRESNRRDKPFIKINCAALPGPLIESELFGFEKGAFTGAVAAKAGKFELAQGGTILLDEVGEMAVETQAKLLRVLQEGEFDRLGSTKTTRVDVRVIAATNVDLLQAVQNKQFRADLYYRLNVFPLETVPLRDRPDDIPLLAQFFMTKYATRAKKKISKISQKALGSFVAYDWPGNVRELENIVERAVVLNDDGKLRLGKWFGQEVQQAHAKQIAIESLDENERRHIMRALTLTNWRVTGERGAARLLEINERTLQSRIKKLGIIRPNSGDEI